MLYLKVRIYTALLACSFSSLWAQADGLNPKVFGYFQSTFGYRKDIGRPVQVKTFSLQQLNLFLQKDFTVRWTAFVNFEFVNSYSSFRNWGAQNLEEAWVSFRGSEQFKLKMGLQVPAFNNLNEIKNKTPVLPYIIRPLAYESSFNEIIALEEFTPTQAFVQAYGFIPARKLKFDYAIFIGNSPNINNDFQRGQTGVDTTRYFLFGGRLGIRTNNLKFGISGTIDQIDFYQVAVFLGYDPAKFNHIPRLRLGSDFSLNVQKWLWESEFIRVTYDDDHPIMNFNKGFFYGTLGRDLTERFFAYAGYWTIRENAQPTQDFDLLALTAGASYNITEAISAKVQYGRVRIESSTASTITDTERSNYYYLAISVVF